jgi:hypothetical protein
MKETATCWIQKETHNRLKVFCALRGLSMVQAITQAVEEWLEQHGPELGKLSPGATSGKANILHTCPQDSYMIHASC